MYDTFENCESYIPLSPPLTHNKHIKKKKIATHVQRRHTAPQVCDIFRVPASSIFSLDMTMSSTSTNSKCMGRTGSGRWRILNGVTIGFLSILVATVCCNNVWQENVRPKLYVEMGKFSQFPFTCFLLFFLFMLREFFFILPFLCRLSLDFFFFGGAR